MRKHTLRTDGNSHAALRLPRSGHTALVALALGVGCSSGGSGFPAAAGITQTVGASGAAITITAAGNPDIAGTTLVIPPNALAADTVITISKGPADETISGETAVGPSVRFAPDGLVFKVPATLILPYRSASVPAANGLAVAVISGGARSELSGAALTVDKAAGTVSCDIAHFTDYQVVAAPGNVQHQDGGSGCKADQDCPGGSICVAGTCHLKAVDGGGTDGSHGDGGISDGGGHGDGGPRDGGPYDGGITDLSPHD